MMMTDVYAKGMDRLWLLFVLFNLTRVNAKQGV